MDATVPLSFAIDMLAIHGTAMTTLIAALVFLALRMGRLPTREDYNELRNEFKAEMAQMRNELREDFRRSHQQIMLALVNHSHRPDGQPVFTLPPELELTPAPAPTSSVD